jgi:hypothetical protein
MSHRAPQSWWMREALTVVATTPVQERALEAAHAKQHSYRRSTTQRRRGPPAIEV